jgi:hypothetical protein
MEGLDKGGQGPISGCCALEEEDTITSILTVLLYIYRIWSLQRKKLNNKCLAGKRSRKYLNLGGKK